MSSNLIQQPYPIILNPHGGGGSAKPAANAEYHVGEIDKDPIQYPRTDLAYKDESGTERLITSPIYTNNSGAFVASKNSSTIINPYMKDGVGYSVLIAGRRGEIYSSKHVGDPGNIDSALKDKLPKYTNIIYEPSSDKTAFENVIAGNPVNLPIGATATCEGGTRLKRIASNGVESDFEAIGTTFISDFTLTTDVDETSNIELCFKKSNFKVSIDRDCVGNPTVPSRKLSGSGFIKGKVSVTEGGMIADLGDINCSQLFVDNYEVLQGENFEINGDGFSEHGIQTQPAVLEIEIKNLKIKKCGGTTQYKSATSFRGTNGKRLKLDNVEIKDCAYSGLTSATIDETNDPNIYSYEKVILGTVLIDGCGNTENPVGDNQHHGCYLATAKKISFNKIIVNNHKRGYGVKFGSSVPRNMGVIIGQELTVNGISEGRGGVTFTEKYENLQISTGLIKDTSTTHIQWIHSGTCGDCNLGSMVFSQTKSDSNNECLDIKGNMNSIDVSRCKINGYEVDGVRRGISDAISVSEGVVIDKFISMGTKVNSIVNHFLRLKKSTTGNGALIKEITIVAPIIQSAGGVFNVEYHPTGGANIERGTITGINAELGSLTNAWVLPARNRLQFEVRENTMKAGGTLIRINDLSYTRMSNITQFDLTYWIDSDTGSSIVPKTFDMEFPDASLNDGYIGKVYNGAAWKNYGQIEE